MFNIYLYSIICDSWISRTHGFWTIWWFPTSKCARRNSDAGGILLLKTLPESQWTSTNRRQGRTTRGFQGTAESENRWVHLGCLNPIPPILNIPVLYMVPVICDFIPYIHHGFQGVFFRMGDGMNVVNSCLSQPLLSQPGVIRCWHSWHVTKWQLLHGCGDVSISSGRGIIDIIDVRLLQLLSWIYIPSLMDHGGIWGSFMCRMYLCENLRCLSLNRSRMTFMILHASRRFFSDSEPQMHQQFLKR